MARESPAEWRRPQPIDAWTTSPGGWGAADYTRVAPAKTDGFAAL